MEITAIDFKSHSRIKVPLEGATEIRGRNGAGKTAILEAIVFALYGKDFYGNIAVDHYVKEGSLSCTAIFSRPGLVVKRSAGNGQTSVYINGIKSKITDALTQVPPVDLAFPIINPLYFLYEMTDLEKRTLFMKLYPIQDRVEIFRDKYKIQDEDLVERFRNSDLDQLKKQRRSLESALSANVGLISSYEEKIISLQETIKTEQSELEGSPRGILEKEKDKQREINEIEERLATLGNVPEMEKKARLDLTDLAHSLRPLLAKYDKEKITDLLQHINKVIVEREEKMEEIADRIKELEVRRSQYEKFASGKCPLCNGDVSEKANEVMELAEEIKPLREQYANLQEQQPGVEALRVDVQETEAQAEMLKSDLATARTRQKEHSRLMKKRDMLRSELVGLSEEDFRKAVEIEAKRENLNRLRKELKDAQKGIVKTEETNESTKGELGTLELLIDALSPQGVDAEIAIATANELQRDMSELLHQEVQISTVRRNKTNSNVKEVFDVKVNGIRFRSLSFGEKIKTAVAFGMVARSMVLAFPLDFVLLDEASVLSKNTLKEIVRMLGEVALIYTVASVEDKLFITKPKW